MRSVQLAALRLVLFEKQLLAAALRELGEPLNPNLQHAEHSTQQPKTPSA